MKKEWIFKSFTQDFFALWGAAFPLIFILMLAPGGRAWGFLALIVYIFIDSGHAYATAFRTYFNKNVFFSSPLYIFVPVTCFILFFSWAFWGWPYLWSFVLYSTFYHNTRQHFGILKWYEKLNGTMNRSSFFLYSLTVLPFIGFHFKNFKYSGIYHDNEFFFVPNTNLFLLAIGVNGLLLLAYLYCANRQLKQKKTSSPVFYAILFPGLVNFCCFYFGSSVDQVLIPMVAIHGIAYYFLTAKVLNNSSLSSKRILSYLVPIVVISASFGFLEYLTQTRFVESASSVTYKGKFLMSLAVSLVVTPLLTHYVLDGVIWKSSDSEFKKLFSQSSTL